MGIVVEVVSQKNANGEPRRDAPTTAQTIAALEEGGVVSASGSSFPLSEAERRFLSPTWLEPKTKNISFDSRTRAVRGTTAAGGDLADIQGMLERFSRQARDLVVEFFPIYNDQLQMGLTSFRPAEVAERVTSWRKDDTRLHVDSFPSRPVQGRRIMRLFANVGQRGRLWHTGESFEQVARTFLPRVKPPMAGSLWLREQLHLTRGRRTPYDHFMLGLHDAMKADSAYQAAHGENEVEFPPGAIWACYTDQVSHAAISGQFALEQTFYLPVGAMQDESRSPLRVLERMLGRPLL